MGQPEEIEAAIAELKTLPKFRGLKVSDPCPNLKDPRVRVYVTVEVSMTCEWDSPDSWCLMSSPFDPELDGPKIHATYKGWDIHFGNDLEVEIYKFVLDDEGYELPEFWFWAWYQTSPEFKTQADRRAFLTERVKAYVDYLGY